MIVSTDICNIWRVRKLYCKIYRKYCMQVADIGNLYCTSLLSSIFLESPYKNMLGDGDGETFVPLFMPKSWG